MCESFHNPGVWTTACTKNEKKKLFLLDQFCLHDNKLRRRLILLIKIMEYIRGCLRYSVHSLRQRSVIRLKFSGEKLTEYACFQQRPVSHSHQHIVTPACCPVKPP